MAEENSLAVDLVLSRFPGPVTVRSVTQQSATKAGLQMAGLFALTTLLILFVDSTGVFIREFWWMLLALGVFVWLGTLFLSAKFLSLDAEKFELVGPFDHETVAWKNVIGFGVLKTNVGRGAVRNLVHCWIRPQSQFDQSEIVIDVGFLDRSFEETSLSVEELSLLMTAWGNRTLGFSAETTLSHPA